MQKIKLNIEELAVSSFEVEKTEAETRGTVHGAEGTDYCSVSCGDPFSSLYVYWAMIAG